MVQWLRVHLAMQGTWVRSLIGELRSHMCGATKPRALEAVCPKQRVQVLRLGSTLLPCCNILGTWSPLPGP